ncbi:hypothetical protein GA0074695_6306 [Micromonospora viridifaciens]|uniref:DUF2231 domain-containing protein n=1 Tax=Micromonospora viridifaciens TaxID=1881 RepID=A0A1C4ZYE6_MICVI|nr:DUF2231 domain-containing protein [Micromonospora viridifaciens]SCF37774.1 hypothetical protein GA0074695_6306 [Micromonospora viridifaciens]
MFLEFNGLPLHVLVVHAVVVLVPLLALISVAYGVVPWWRSRLDWAVAGLAVVTPIVAFVATESGEAFEEAQRERGLGGEFLRKIEEHAEYGDTLRWFTVGLAVAALLLLLVTSGLPRARGLPRWLAPVLTGVVVVLAAFALVYVYLTGDSGAQVVWGGTI